MLNSVLVLQQREIKSEGPERTKNHPSRFIEEGVQPEIHGGGVVTKVQEQVESHLKRKSDDRESPKKREELHSVTFFILGSHLFYSAVVKSSTAFKSKIVNILS